MRAMLSGITWTRKAACGLAILAASYLVAAFANASPITQPSLAGAPSRLPLVIVVPDAKPAIPVENAPATARPAALQAL
jgi:hypothetical protein